MSPRRIVAISGSSAAPSKTTRLTRAIAEAVAAGGAGWSVESFDLSTLGPALGAARGRNDAAPELVRAWQAVETADALVVGSPTYKASYSGLLKHFFDLMDMHALTARPVIVCATARAPAHALMIDHQFRPLFAFFNASVMPTGIFAVEPDFAPDGAPGPALAARIAQAAAEMNHHTRPT